MPTSGCPSRTSRQTTRAPSPGAPDIHAVTLVVQTYLSALKTCKLFPFQRPSDSSLCPWKVCIFSVVERAVKVFTHAGTQW